MRFKEGDVLIIKHFDWAQNKQIIVVCDDCLLHYYKSGIYTMSRQLVATQIRNETLDMFRHLTKLDKVLFPEVNTYFSEERF